MNDLKKDQKETPFFAQFLEDQDVVEAQGAKGFTTLKYPSDGDEINQTMKYPSDGDEGYDV